MEEIGDHNQFQSDNTQPQQSPQLGDQNNTTENVMNEKKIQVEETHNLEQQNGAPIQIDQTEIEEQKGQDLQNEPEQEQELARQVSQEGQVAYQTFTDTITNNINFPEFNGAPNQTDQMEIEEQKEQDQNEPEQEQELVIQVSQEGQVAYQTLANTIANLNFPGGHQEQFEEEEEDQNQDDDTAEDSNFTAQIVDGSSQNDSQEESFEEEMQQDEINSKFDSYLEEEDQLQKIIDNIMQQHQPKGELKKHFESDENKIQKFLNDVDEHFKKIDERQYYRDKIDEHQYYSDKIDEEECYGDDYENNASTWLSVINIFSKQERAKSFAFFQCKLGEQKKNDNKHECYDMFIKFIHESEKLRQIKLIQSMNE